MMSALEATMHLRRLTLSARRWQWRIAGLARRCVGHKRTTYVDERIAEYRAYWKSAAQALGASFEPLWEDLWEVCRAGRSTRISNYLVQIDDPVTLRLAGNKPYCCAVARRHGIPVAPHRLFRLADLEAALQFMDSRAGPFVVKPASRSSAALGITMHVRTRREFESAAALASLYSDELMVEAMVPAESCRLLYLDGELIHAVRRRGVRVTGDGRSSIAGLLARQGLQRLWSDAATLCTLEAQRLSPGSRLAPGKEIVVRYLPALEKPARELRTVYNECITALVCPQLARALVPVVREIGTRFAGIDLLTNDPSVPLAASGGVFLELNTTPGIHHHYIGGEGPAVAVRVLRYLLEEAQLEERRDRPFPAERRALS